MSLARTGGYHTDLTAIPPRSSLRYTERYSKERLERLRRTGDPLTDPLARALHEDYGGLTNIHDLLTTVKAKAEEGIPVFQEFIHHLQHIPAWAQRDKAKIERGQRIHAVHTPFMGLSLFSGSLVGGSQFITAAVVTALAGNISTDPTRRITETGLLLAALAFPGSLFEAGGEAHDSLTRVRLLHSALRYWLPKSGRLEPHRSLVPEHVYVEGEVPINQHDLAITLGIFCYLNLRSLRRMGIVLSKDDIECYVAMWRYAGYVLGIEESLLPTSLEDQEEFMLASMLHQGVPDYVDGEGIKGFIGAFAKAGSESVWGLVPESTLNTYLQQMTRYLNGEEYVTGMEIDNLGDSHWSVLVTWTFGYFMGTIIPRLPLGERLLFNLHTSRIRRALRERGEPTGHMPGTGKDISGELSKL